MLFQNKKAKILIVIIAIVFLGSTATLVLAQNTGTTPPKPSTSAQTQVKLPDPLGGRDIPVLVGDVIKYILGFVGVLALVMFIYGGIVWMTSAGASEKVKKGRETIVWAVIGLTFVFFSYAILHFILKALIK